MCCQLLVIKNWHFEIVQVLFPIALSSMHLNCRGLLEIARGFKSDCSGLVKVSHDNINSN